jgi:hypothetical protein
MKKYHLVILSVLLFGFVCIFQSTLSGQVKVIKVIVGSANVRVKPDFASQVITRLPLGTLLESTAKTGDWYQISVSPDEKSAAVTGYIHQSTVQEVQTTAKPETETPPPAKAAQPVLVQKEPQETAVPPAPPKYRPEGSGGNLFSGFYIKLGWMASPDAGGFGKSWLSSFGYDFGFGRNFALGFELQPAYRSYPEIDLTVIPIMGFVNVKAGENAGRLIPFMKFLDIVCGAGIGLEASYAKTIFDGQTYTNFRTLFAFHLLLGGEIDFKTFKLLLDYQLTQLSDPNVNPNFWRNYLMFGIRF